MAKRATKRQTRTRPTPASGRPPDRTGMTLTPRSAPYAWVTWLTGLIAGEDHCAWAAWLKAHYQYRRRPSDNPDALSRWMATHDALVMARVNTLTVDGWAVSVEDQNALTVHGEAATIGGKPDIVAARDDRLLIVDAKGGRAKHKYIWQVRVYLALLPLQWPERCAGKQLVGHVEYPDEIVDVTLAPGDAQRIYETIKMVGGPEPPTTPSARGCKYCDIAECPDRWAETLTTTAEKTP